MAWQQLVMDIFDRIDEEMEHVLVGLTPEELNRQPSPGANSIGWLTWHLTRSHDRNMSEIMRKEQLWIADGWYNKFGRAADANETGYGHSLEEASAFHAPDSETILEYYRAIVERIRQYIENDLSEAELDREYYSPTFSNNGLVLRSITGVINDSLQHVGQAAYVRGLITKQGWYGR